MTPTPAVLAQAHVDQIRRARASAIVSNTFAFLHNSCRLTVAPTPQYLFLEESSCGSVTAFSQMNSVHEAVRAIERPQNDRAKFYLHDLDTGICYEAERRVVAFNPHTWPSDKQHPDRIATRRAKVTVTVSSGRIAFAEVDGDVDVFTTAA